jgi:hypothetical protein
MEPGHPQNTETKDDGKSQGKTAKVDTDPKDSGRVRSNKKQVKLVLSPRGIRVHDKQP